MSIKSTEKYHVSTTLTIKYHANKQFIMKSVIGGRVMVANNKPAIVNESLVDLDAKSLYPTAIVKGVEKYGGLPTGNPLVIKINRNTMKYDVLKLM